MKYSKLSISFYNIKTVKDVNNIKLYIKASLT